MKPTLDLVAPPRAEIIAAAGLPAAEIDAWLAARPVPGGALDVDGPAFSAFWRQGAALRARLPAKPVRGDTEAAAVAEIVRLERAARDAFLGRHLVALYDRLTNDRANHLRVAGLLAAAAGAVPGLVPDADDLAREGALLLKEKEGLEKAQGVFLAHALADADIGRHLIKSMLLPKPESLELFERFDRDGRLELDYALVERQGAAAVVEMRNPRYLNAIDCTSIPDIETAVDIAILDPKTRIAVLRGGVVEHRKYAGKRIFSAGINLTRLYKGEVPFLFYFYHIIGFELKIFRGLARPDASVDDVDCATIEKGWVATVDTFAIGGGCQHLLVMDYVLAASDAYLTLPARKEGIIPGAANLRLPRFVGDRIARQAILYDRRFECDSPEGRLICDEIVAPDEMDAAVKRVVDNYTTSGVVSIVSNRRQLRIGQEPLDAFRLYMAQFAREQADCHFSDGLIGNLERYWNAQNR